MKIGINDVLKQIRLFFIPYLVVLCVCLILKTLFTKDAIYFAVNGIHSPFTDLIAPYITDIGNGWTTVALAAITLLFSYRTSFLLATTYAITSLSAQVVKFIVDAPRPLLYFEGRTNKMYLVKGVEILKYNSFPSGHTVTAFSTAIVICYLVKNKSWSIMLLLVAICVGYSRMYLSEHFFEDVTAGSALGVIITICWLSFIENKQFLQAAKWNKGLLKKN